MCEDVDVCKMSQSRWKKLHKMEKENLLLKQANNFKPSKFLEKINPEIISEFNYIRDNLSEFEK